MALWARGVAWAQPAQPDATPNGGPPPVQSPAVGSGQIDLAPADGAAAQRPALPDTPDLAPPLSIYESCLRLADLIRELEQPRRDDATTSAAIAPRLRRLNLVQRYVERVDQAHSSLPYYQWRRIISEKVPRRVVGTMRHKPALELANITALAFTVHNGDVEIQKIVAVDRNRTRWEFNRVILLVAEQPRREVCFLPLPTDLVEVEITCRELDATDGEWPRLFIEAGVSSEPESAKQAVYYMQLAVASIKAGQFPEAAKPLRAALELLKDYQRSRRL